MLRVLARLAVQTQCPLFVRVGGSYRHDQRVIAREDEHEVEHATGQYRGPRYLNTMIDLLCRWGQVCQGYNTEPALPGRYTLEKGHRELFPAPAQRVVVWQTGIEHQ